MCLVYVPDAHKKQRLLTIPRAGTVPESIGNLAKLTELNLEGNALTGPFCVEAPYNTESK